MNYDKKKKLREVLVYQISILAFIMCFNLVFLNAKIPSGSMQKTLNPKDRVLCIRTGFTFDIKRGDIVVFKAPLTGELYIKRVIGLPGETISVKNGLIYVNGSKEAIREPYLNRPWAVANNRIKVSIPNGCYWVLGDNRDNSNDARFWPITAKEQGLENPESYAFVSREAIVAKAWLRYFPSLRILK